MASVENISKSMKHALRCEAERREEIKRESLEARDSQPQDRKENGETISFLQLRQIIEKDIKIDLGRENGKVSGDIESPQCRGTRSKWDGVGSGQEWDVVFVDHEPMEERTTSVNRLLTNSRLVIIHDTENFVNKGNPMKYPQDFM